MISSLPTPEDPDPRDAPALKWGVCGPGDIAESFTAAVHAHSGQRVVAVASRSRARAEAFAAKHSVASAYQGHEELFADPRVDVVYVSVPDGLHAKVALAALAAGKPVVVEKPLAMSREQGAAVAAAARDSGLFAMEAMWARYLPQASILRQLVHGGDLGDVRAVEASFGFAVPYDPTAWAWDPALGGGALAGFGIYPLAYAGMVLGPPDPARVVARGLATPDGVDVHSAAILDYGTAHATVLTTMLAQAPITATVYGSGGYVALDETFVIPSGLQFAQAEGPRLAWRDASGIADRGGLAYEAAAAARFIAEGRVDSPVYSLDESLSTLAVIDEVKRQIVAAGEVWTPYDSGVDGRPDGRD
jgi:predicted dehydrogenase